MIKLLIPLKNRYNDFKVSLSKKLQLSPKYSQHVRIGFILVLISAVPIILVFTLFQNSKPTRSVRAVVTPPTPTSTSSATPTIKPTSGINGIVFLDINKNKKMNNPPAGGEKGIEGIVLQLFLKGKTKASYSTISDKNGSYSFKKIANGSYLVKLTVPPTYRITTNSSLSINYKGTAATANFGLVKVPTIYGKTFVDSNANRKLGVSEQGVNGVKLTLKKGRQTLRRVSGTGGSYNFSGVTSGKYTLSVIAPSGYRTTSSSYTVTFKKTDLILNIPLTKSR